MVCVLLYYTTREQILSQVLMLNVDVFSYRSSFIMAYIVFILIFWLSSHDPPFISLEHGPVDHCTIQRRDKQRSERIDGFPACCCSVILFEWSSDLANSRPGCFKQEKYWRTKRQHKMPVFTGMAMFHRNTCFCGLEMFRTIILSCAGM